jgi:hypothetical protein
MVKGLSAFAEFFSGYEEQYVLIGGVATVLALESAGLDARATKDLDIVLCVEALTPEFGGRMWDFIRAGGYAVNEQGPEPRCFYRFRKPSNPDFPSMLEFFAREPGFAPLAEGAHLTPVPIDEAVESLSAILLDEGYYRFIHANKRMLEGVNVVTADCLIPLKARAWLDLRARKARGEDIDSKNISKHRGDVLRLSQLLTPGTRTAVAESIADDLRRFLAEMQPELDAALMKSLGMLGQSPEETVELLRETFEL